MPQESGFLVVDWVVAGSLCIVEVGGSTICLNEGFFGMPIHDRPLVLLLAMFTALVVNVVGLTALDFLVAHPPGRWSLEPSLPEDEEEDEEDAADEEEVLEEEDEFKPGIEDGAPAKVTWIGYDEYEEHLAELAKVEQALFTMADGGVVGAPVEEQPLVEPVEPIEAEVELVEAEEVVEEEAPLPSELVSAVDDAEAVVEELIAEEEEELTAEEEQPEEDEAAAAVEEVEEELDLPMEIADEAALVDDADAVVDAAEDDALVLPSETETESETEEVEEAAVVEPVIDEEVTEAVVVDPPAPIEEAVEEKEEVVEEAVKENAEQVEAVPAVTPVVSGTTDKESPDPRPTDAEPTDKESAATSIKPVPKIEWNAGKPLAVEGMEIKPYSLARHIIIDSKDRLFGLNSWNGRIKRNPVVSLRFDKYGRVAQQRVIRDSGYVEFDRRYLVSWLARWTARDKRLAELGAKEMTNAIVIKIAFIEEKVEEEKKSAEKKGVGGK